MFFYILFLVTAANATSTWRDPTMPYGYVANESAAENNVQIDAVIIGSKGNTVIINGERLTVGDTFMGGKIISIDPNEIHIQDNAGSYVIGISKIKVKVPTKVHTHEGHS